MKEGLNLLPSMAKFQAAKIKLKKKINLVMIIFLGGWVLTMVIVFGWLWTNKLLLANAKKTNTSSLNKYKSLVNNAVLSKKNKYQAKLVGEVLSERFEYGASIQKITTLFSDNVVLKNFEINDKRQFVLDGYLVNGNYMNEIEEKVKEINSGLVAGFKSAKLDSVGISDDGWLFEMEVDLT
jgi:hypothetical protein